MFKKIIAAAFFMFMATPAQSKTFNVTLTKDNTINMSTYFDSESTAKVVAKAKELDARLPTNEPLYLVLDTGGGSIWSGLEFIENLRNLNRPVRTITMFAASMGFHTVEGLGPRLIQETGVLMSHKAKGGFWGEFPGQLDSRYSMWLKRVKLMDERVVKRTKGKHTLKSYAALVENEYWCEGKECIDQGFADFLVRAKCDKSLSGTREDNYKLFWKGYAVELVWVYDACPLNTGELDFKIYVNGKPIFERDKPDGSSSFSFGLVDIPDHKELQLKIDEIKNDKANRVVKKGY